MKAIHETGFKGYAQEFIQNLNKLEPKAGAGYKK
jgi:hypothetical protein